MHLAPGSPTDLVTELNPKVSEIAKERLTKLYGLDKPLHIQYWNWLKRMAVLDFGRSFGADGRPVLDKIAQRMPITVTINLLSLLIVLCGGRARGHIQRHPPGVCIRPRPQLSSFSWDSPRPPSGWRYCA